MLNIIGHYGNAGGQSKGYKSGGQNYGNKAHGSKASKVLLNSIGSILIKEPKHLDRDFSNF